MMKRNGSGRNQAAFTLIELLVVIGIIGILAAILFPVFSQARDMARATASLSNMQQIGHATQMYAQDYDETLIPWRNCPVRSQDGVQACSINDQVASLWTNTIQPYQKNKDILFCPSYSDANTAKAMDQADCDGNGSPGSGSAGLLPADQYFSHYGLAPHSVYNAGQCDQTGAAPYANFPGSGWTSDGGVYHFQAATYASISEVARTANLTDGLTFQGHDQNGPFVGTLFGCEGRFRFREGANIAFMDGHAKWISDNPEHHLATDDNQCYYEKYFAADK